MNVTKKHYVDPELSDANRILQILTKHHPAGRRRVLATVCARAHVLPYLGTEPEIDERQIPMFDLVDPEPRAPVVEFSSRERVVTED